MCPLQIPVLPPIAMSAPAAVDRPSNAPESCVGPASDEAGKASACAGCPNQAACAAGEGKKEDPALREVAERLANVKHKILVLSGKGGVGKVRRDRSQTRSELCVAGSKCSLFSVRPVFSASPPSPLSCPGP